MLLFLCHIFLIEIALLIFQYFAAIITDYFIFSIAFLCRCWYHIFFSWFSLLHCRFFAADITCLHTIAYFAICRRYYWFATDTYICWFIFDFFATAFRYFFFSILFWYFRFFRLHFWFLILHFIHISFSHFQVAFFSSVSFFFFFYFTLLHIYFWCFFHVFHFFHAFLSFSSFHHIFRLLGLFTFQRLSDFFIFSLSFSSSAIFSFISFNIFASSDIRHFFDYIASFHSSFSMLLLTSPYFLRLHNISSSAFLLAFSSFQLFIFNNRFSISWFRRILFRRFDVTLDYISAFRFAVNYFISILFSTFHICFSIDFRRGCSYHCSSPSIFAIFRFFVTADSPAS